MRSPTPYYHLLMSFIFSISIPGDGRVLDLSDGYNVRPAFFICVLSLM